jgi:hypothetical protein
LAALRQSSADDDDLAIAFDRHPGGDVLNIAKSDSDDATRPEGTVEAAVAIEANDRAQISDFPSDHDLAV